jgi:transcriptional regulator with XRE-family HTH domain
LLDEIVASIGPKVRDLRLQKGLSLQQLADRSGVSAAAIHKVERNGMVPTITTLMKLAGALNRSVSYFVEEDSDVDKVAALVRHGDRKPVFTSREGLRLENISGPYGRFFVAGAWATVEPSADSGRKAMEHPGEELVCVVSGTLEFEVDGDSYTVGPGDSLHFRTDRPHRWRNPTSKPAEALWIALRPS